MSDVPPVFATLFRVIHEPHEADQPHRNEIEEDIEAEGETLPDTEHDDGEPAALDISQLQEFLLDASKGVTSDTDKEYKRCDEHNFDGTMKPHDQKRDSYNHAQKMRASMTYAFGRLCGLGSLPWHESEVTGRMVGNPSVSETVATYMTSLRRRKETLFKLYHFNHQPEVAEIKEYAAGSRKTSKLPTDWGGGRARRLLILAYVLSFLASSGVKPFYLHLLLPHLAHLCPVRALAEWLKVSGITDGYLFRKMASGDRVSPQNSPMVCYAFVIAYPIHLLSRLAISSSKCSGTIWLDIRIDPYPYGTHSFRRGGCQWLYTCCRWGLIRICDWGGWSTEFSSLTIVKYLISYVDDPSERREDYMNPNRPPSLKCFSCGRTCHCI
ncbi:DNA breaking-rejoining enzyme [Mycena olivaceomarginata]|nr:DNA breaking-rejoining enzyme [Mycena olivaceomarginata]